MGRPTSTSPSPDAAGVALYVLPSDVTLVKEILRPWVTTGDTKPGSAFVHAADVYSADPEELARRFRPAVSLDGDRTWYFLSPLRNKSPRDRRKVRAVADGAGCWHSEAAPKIVVDHGDGGRHVGYRQSFSFMRRGDAGVDVRAGWIMTEFHLHQSDGSDARGRKVEGFVLCKVYRSPRNRVPAVTDGEDDVISGVTLSAEATVSCRRMSKEVNDEDSNTVTPRWQPHTKNADGVAMATAMTAPLPEKKAAGDDRVSGTTTAAAPCAKNKENKEVIVVDDEDLVVSSPARKKMRVGVGVVDAASSGAAPAALKVTTAGALDAAAQLHCPQCGFHLAALQALVTLTKSKSLFLPRGEAGDSDISRA